MRLVELNYHPSESQLRQFGLIAAVAAPILGWFWTASSVATLLTAGGALAVLGLWKPQSLRWIFVGLSLAAFPFGWLVSELFLWCLFYCVVLPTGLVCRLMGHDPLQRKLDPKAPSYWQPTKQPLQTASYLRRW